MTKPVITVVGSSNIDLVAIVPHLPVPGETLIGSDIRLIPGGKGANQAVAARRLGADVNFIGCLGNDSFGEMAEAELAHEGVRLDYLVRVAGVSSGLALIAVSASGENTIVVAPGANSQLTPSNVDSAAPAIQVSQVVIAQLEVPIAAVKRAFTLARQAGARTLLNPAPAQVLPGDLIALVDVLVCNETEATMLTALPVTDRSSATGAASILRERGMELVVVTLGRDGCVLAVNNSLSHVAAFAVPVVDSTAAGDAFIGALACRIALGDAPIVAAEYATAAAALSVSALGAQPSLPTGVSVSNFLKKLKFP